MNRNRIIKTLGYAAIGLAVVIALMQFKYLVVILHENPASFLGDMSAVQKEFTMHFFKWAREKNPGFLLHVVFGAIALGAGGLQMRRKFRPGKVKTHRFWGYVYFLAVIPGAIGGLIVAPQAFGGLVVRTGFFIAGVLWLATLWPAFAALREKNYAKHEAWVFVNYAICFAAVTLRLEQNLLQAIGVDVLTTYRIVAWASWMPNLALALYLERNRLFASRGKSAFQGV